MKIAEVQNVSIAVESIGVCVWSEVRAVGQVAVWLNWRQATSFKSLYILILRIVGACISRWGRSAKNVEGGSLLNSLASDVVRTNYYFAFTFSL